MFRSPGRCSIYAAGQHIQYHHEKEDGWTFIGMCPARSTSFVDNHAYNRQLRSLFKLHHEQHSTGCAYDIRTEGRTSANRLRLQLHNNQSCMYRCIIIVQMLPLLYSNAWKVCKLRRRSNHCCFIFIYFQSFCLKERDIFKCSPL